MDMPEKINTNDSRLNNTFLSTEGVSILDSIEETVSCRLNENDNSLATHEKPGYALRSYVEKFIDTKTGLSPSLRRGLAGMTFFQPFMSGVVSGGTNIRYPPDSMP